MNKIDLSGVCGVGLDETARKRGHNYVTIFIDMDRESRPVIFACPGKGKEFLNEFAKFIKQQAGNVDNIAEVVCDMSPAFIAAATEQFPNAAITVDWFHVVKLFTDAMDSVRRAEAKTETLPKGTRWAILKGDKTSRAQRAYRARTSHSHSVSGQRAVAMGARSRHEVRCPLAIQSVFGFCTGAYW